jgi:hypothetical protein
MYMHCHIYKHASICIFLIVVSAVFMSWSNLV